MKLRWRRDGPTAHILVETAPFILAILIVCGRCCGKVKALAIIWSPYSSQVPSTGQMLAFSVP